ncbi:hypothetical protein [Tenacibaculum insulae]|uniref:hypothetical protein n=1 Tax=Tenacibaculum insulae TaxID=2029677 RepID=UPI003AB358D8
MKTILKLIIILLTPFALFSQNEPTEAINGKYYLLEAENGIGREQTKEKLFQFGMFGKDKVLAIAACPKKCMPAIYKYKEDESKQLGFPVFYNDYGLFVFTYDKDSFVIVKMSNKKDAGATDFSFSNFYSKSKAKVATMTKEKIKDFVISFN